MDQKSNNLVLLIGRRRRRVDVELQNRVPGRQVDEVRPPQHVPTRHAERAAPADHRQLPHSLRYVVPPGYRYRAAVVRPVLGEDCLERHEKHGPVVGHRDVEPLDSSDAPRLRVRALRQGVVGHDDVTEVSPEAGYGPFALDQAEGGRGTPAERVVHVEVQVRRAGPNARKNIKSEEAEKDGAGVGTRASHFKVQNRFNFVCVLVWLEQFIETPRDVFGLL